MSAANNYYLSAAAAEPTDTAAANDEFKLLCIANDLAYELHGARYLLENAEKLFKAEEAVWMQRKSNYWTYNNARIALKQAEKNYAEMEAKKDAANAAYDAAHNMKRAAELRRREADDAECRRMTVEAFRAMIQPEKDTLIAHAQKFIGIIKKTIELTDDEMAAAVEKAKVDIKTSNNICGKVRYYLREGIKDMDLEMLETFLERIYY